MSAYDINEVPAYRTSDGRVIKAADLTEITAYETPDGTLYVSKEEAQASLLRAAFNVVGRASAEDLAAAHVCTTEESPAYVIKVALRYITATMGNA